MTDHFKQALLDLSKAVYHAIISAPQGADEDLLNDLQMIMSAVEDVINFGSTSRAREILKQKIEEDELLETFFMAGRNAGVRLGTLRLLYALKNNRDMLKALARGYEHEASHQIGEPGAWEFAGDEPEWVEDLIACAKEAVSEMIKHMEAKAK